ncbi:MAG: ATP-binding protein [Gammaproteobacteria bacterium]
MGRLFWKFFFAFWLALLTAGTGVGTAVWLLHAGDHRGEFASAPEHVFPDRHCPPPPSEFAAAPAPLPPPLHKFPPPRKPPPPWLAITAGSIASVLFSAALAWYFAKPIRSLRTAFAAVARGNLEVRIAAAMGKRHDELADLGCDFDHMAAQIGSLVTAQQRLLHDVSHELRSPLARLQAAVGLMQQQPDKLPATLERIERESQRISDLVGELLVLSRLEAGVANDAVGDVDLGGLLDDIVEDARFEAEQRHVAIRYGGVEDVIVKARGELLQRAVENVLRNAVQHCKTGGEVTVSAVFETASRRLLLSIDDQGSGVAENDLQAIFQPFFRSGTRHRSDSVGLGLTIARRALEAHGGRIRAANRPQGGLHVEMEILFPG